MTAELLSCPLSAAAPYCADGDGTQATLHLRFVGTSAIPRTMQTERVVKVGGDGRLSFSQSSAAGVQLVIDLMGYYLTGFYYHYHCLDC